MRFKNPNTSRIAKNKISALFNRIVTKTAERDKASIFDILSELFVQFKMFFTKVNKPRFQFTPFKKGDVVVAEKYNDVIIDSIEDIAICTDEAEAIKPMIIGSYNAARQMAKELENRSEAALSKITDIRLFEGQLGQEIIVIGDDFLNTNKVDENFSLSAPSADVRTADGLVTLNRIEIVNVVDENTDVVCEPVMPGDIVLTGDSYGTNVNRYYEGNYYNFIDLARPEGGIWHIEERSLLTQDELTATSEFTSTNTPPTSTYSDTEYIPGTAIRPQDLAVYDRGATLAEKNNIRKKMFDEDSSTFWEAEYVKNLDVGTDSGAFTDYVDLTLDELAAEAIGQDTKDFEVQITVDLGREKSITWLSLDPINFGETAWLEITDISTQSSEQEGFKTIPNLFNNRFANTLTNEANEELQADIAAAILAPDRYSFKGKGVFSFPAVFGQYVRIKVKQKVPVPSLYQRLAVQLTRSVDTTVTRSRSSGIFSIFTGGGGSNTEITQTRMSRVIYLTYAQTLSTFFNEGSVGGYAGETESASSNNSSSRGHGGLLGGLADIFFGRRRTSTSTQDSGWQVAQSFLTVSYDKMRYAIGIRELSIFNYRFSPTSEFVTKKFTSPKEIIKAQLEVVEEIPAEFNPNHRYIEYYLSFDGENWHRINPTDSPTLYLDDGQIAPEIINVNFDVAGAGPNQTVKNISTDNPANAVRLKVVMKNDPSLGDSDMYSPVLKKYRIKLFPRTSLSRT